MIIPLQAIILRGPYDTQSGPVLYVYMYIYTYIYVRFNGLTELKSLSFRNPVTDL